MAKDEKPEKYGAAEIDAQAAQLRLDREKLLLEQQQLELEDTREQVEERKRKRAEKKRTRELQEATLAQQWRDRFATMRECNHKKGGKGVNAVVHGQGNDSNYAVVKHQYGNGQVWILCQRCLAEWRPGDTAATHPTGIGYREALAFPTDNEMSTSVQFQFHKAPGAAA